MRPLAILAAALVLAVPAWSASRAGFTPSSLAGSWNGTWHNETFGSTGPAAFSVKVLTFKAPKPKKKHKRKPAPPPQLIFSADFGGNVFGCADPPAETTKPLTKGTGPGHWNAGGFELQGDSQAFGSVHFIYDQATGALTGEGSNPPCASGLSWSLQGTFAGTTFTGTVSISLPAGVKAVSDLSLTRS